MVVFGEGIYFYVHLNDFFKLIKTREEERLRCGDFANKVQTKYVTKPHTHTHTIAWPHINTTVRVCVAEIPNTHCVTAETSTLKWSHATGWGWWVMGGWRCGGQHWRPSCSAGCADGDCYWRNILYRSRPEGRSHPIVFHLSSAFCLRPPPSPSVPPPSPLFYHQ